MSHENMLKNAGGEVNFLDLKSPDLTSQYIDKIGQLFPEVLTERRDEHGRLEKAINFEKLKDLLSHDITEGRETYEFTWVGKRAAMAEAGRPTSKTLRPDLDESVDFEKSENVFITGDNLEVLKILQESYLGKIDMIYIDPPYNTGKGFVYKDEFEMSADDYKERMGLLDEEGRQVVGLTKNEKSSARYHSDWLNMMYPRLRLARNLLKDSGVIFISIDDNEQANLKALCDEIFGEENFITQFIWRRSGTGGLRGIFPVTTHEYVVAYGKDILKINQPWMAPYTKEALDAFKEEDERGLYKTQALYLTSLKQTASQSYFIDLPDGTRAKPPVGIGSWRFIEKTYKEELESGNIVFKEVKNSPLVTESGEQAKYNIYTKQYISGEGTNPSSIFPEDIVGQTRSARSKLKKLFSKDVFEYSKPDSLVKFLVSVINKPKDSLILDFFAGSYVIIVLVVKSLIKSRVLVLLHNIKTLKNSNLCVV